MYKDGFIVNEIDAHEQIVQFSNDIRVRSGLPNGALTETILKLQIEATVRQHFQKELRLKSEGIKVLSVFFIDRVANYRVYEEGGAAKGKLAVWFEEIFERYRSKSEYAGLYDFSAEAVHAGYFSQDKEGRFKDSTEKPTQDDNDTYALIMRKKEVLLDPAEPVRFIFSHSALREGWDNPNVFQICTLADTSSEIKKRQEIGRGLRLAVDKDGQRVLDRNVNRLTVIANESYEDFAKDLQKEMEDQGIAFKKELIHNERKKVTVRLKKGYEADHHFLQLWEHIRNKTRYKVSYSTAKLIETAVEAIRNLPSVERPRIVITRAELNLTSQGIKSKEVGRKTESVDSPYIIPDLVGQIQGQTSLSKSTVGTILLKSGRLEDALQNPQVFIERVTAAINDTKRELLVQGVEYVKVNGSVYEMHRFQADDLMELFESNVMAVQKQEKTLFSHIVIDSGSGPERTFARACDDNEDVHFYIKLPRWFVIETPVGTYNPDWALVYHNDKTIYFVAETKSDVNLSLLRPLERLKIECGKKHFEQFEGVCFRVVRSLSGLVS